MKTLSANNNEDFCPVLSCIHCVWPLKPHRHCTHTFTQCSCANVCVQFLVTIHTFECTAVLTNRDWIITITDLWFSFVKSHVIGVCIQEKMQFIGSSIYLFWATICRITWGLYNYLLTLRYSSLVTKYFFNVSPRHIFSF